MMKKTYRPKKRIRVSLEDKVELLLKNKANSQQVTFHFHDGTTIVQELKDAFLKGKRASQLVSDLKSITHDLHAKYFTI